MSNTALVPVGSHQVMPANKIAVAGFSLLDEKEDMAIPYVRVVQPTSSDTSLMNGGDAKGGQFLDISLRTAYNELLFSILSVAKFDVQWQGREELQTIYLVLCADEQLQPFVLKVSGTSVFALKSLITSITRIGLPYSWAMRVRAVTEKRESTKDGNPRKWFSIRFYLLGENSPEDVERLASMAEELSIGEALPPLEPDEIV